MSKRIITIAVCLGMSGCGWLGAVRESAQPFHSLRVQPGVPPPLIVLLSLDTLRADHVRGFGGRGNPSPRLARLADDGLRVTAATAEFTWTLPSHYSMLFSRLYGFAIEPGPESLASALSAAGFATVAVTGGGWTSAKALREGFDTYRTEWMDNQDAEPMVEQALEWIDRLADEPAFLFLHTYAVHAPAPSFAAHLESSGPLVPYRVSDEQLEEDLAFYRELVGELDDTLEPLLGALERTAWARPVLLVVTADHGQAFGEHDNYGHGASGVNASLNDEIVRIPLIVWSPGVVPAGRTLAVPTSLSDIAPTLLEAVGVEAPSGMRGSSQWALWSGQTAPRGDEPGTVSHLSGSWSYRRPPDKLLVTMRAGGREELELYDLKTDPGERRNLAAEQPEKVAELADELLERLVELGVQPSESDTQRFPRGDCDSFAGWKHCGPDRSRVKDAAEGVDDETLEQLRALGYVE